MYIVFRDIASYLNLTNLAIEEKFIIVANLKKKVWSI